MPEDAVLEAPAELETPSDEGTVEEVEQPEGEVTNLGEEAEAEGDEPVEGEEAEGEQAEEDKEEVAPDGRKMPDDIKKSLKALRGVSPEAAKKLKGIFWAEQDYRQAFPLPADAVAAKTLIEEIGGTEGIQQIQAERDEWNQLDKSFAEGSPDFVKAIAESNPEAFQKTAAHVINEFASRAPEQYQYYANNVAYNTVIGEPGVQAGLQQLSQLHAQLTEAPWAQQAIASVVNGIVGLKEKAAQFEQKRSSVDPEREKLQQEKTQFEQQRRANFEEGVASQSEKYLAEKMQPELDRVIAGRKIDPEAMKGYQKMVNDEVMRRLGDIPGFADKLEAHYRTGDAKKSVEYIQAQYNRILPEAAKVIAPFLRNIAPGKPAPKPGTPAAVSKTSAGEVVLNEMPGNSAFDWTKTTVADVIQGHGILKNGKRASGWA